jgi:two-component system chemotaxis response regulator CheY
VPGQLRALIVDDNAYARSATAATLRKLGIGTVVEAEGGAAAVAILASDSFDVMLMDWYMPDVSGAGLIQIVRDPRFGRTQKLPVVLITAYPSRENVAKARELGINEVLTKPFTADHVMLALGRVLHGSWETVPDAEEQVTAAVGSPDKIFI